MCGIAGYVQSEPAPEGTLSRMTARIAHRGPDGSGEWTSASADGRWHVALGHRRLAIIDVAGGRQPLGNEDGSLQITFNGEIYNFALLRAALERRGHRFATRCDTEAIVHHVEEHGPRGIEELDGIFAFALWDQTTGRLLLARDRAGVKPLYYAPLPDGGLAFASELSALLQHPMAPRNVSPTGIGEYFFRDYVPSPNTVIDGVYKLPPGAFLLWDANRQRPTPQTYWRPRGPDEFSSDVKSCDAALAKEIRQRLEDAVSSQLMSDVPIGVFLSGGIDSSAVASIAKKHVDGELLTFSIGFEDSEFDESAHARRVARHIGSSHHEATLCEGTMLESLNRALDCWDEPVGDPSIVPTYLLSKLAATRVKVILGGDGADELWGGYPTYKAHQYAAHYAKIPAMLRRRLLCPLVAGLKVRDGYQSLEWKAKRFVMRWADDPIVRHQRWMSSTDLPGMQRAMPGIELFAQPRAKAPDPSSDVLDRVLTHDFAGYLPGSVLAKVDRASMAHGLEVRTPMLANPLIDLAFSISANRKLRRGSKHLLKSAVRDMLPAEILSRPKRGFSIPLSRWLKGSLSARLTSILRDSPVWELSCVVREPFEEWIIEHGNGSADHSKTIWSLLVLDHWMRRNLRQP